LTWASTGTPSLNTSDGFQINVSLSIKLYFL
jgi:hypothetical protein